MLEDKLSKEERLRLECLAQANVAWQHNNTRQIIERAAQFEQYVKDKTAIKKGYTVRDGEEGQHEDV